MTASPLVPTWIAAATLTPSDTAIAIHAGICAIFPMKRFPSRISQVKASSGISGIRKRIVLHPYPRCEVTNDE